MPNPVVVPVSDGKVDLYNRSGTVDLLADVEGYHSASGSTFHNAGPVRIMDTRSGTGVRAGTIGAKGMLSHKVAGVGGLPTSGVTAVVLNVTATGTTATGFVTVYPDGKSRPTSSDLNFGALETVSNLVVVRVIDGKVDFYNSAGHSNLVADLTGYCTG